VFYIGVLPPFVVDNGAVLPQTAILSLVYVMAATAIHAAIVGLAGSARLFLDEPVHIRLTRRVLSAALAAIALWFAYATAR
jgi:threonine/homoserine/homoserine lactone efflux protein